MPCSAIFCWSMIAILVGACAKDCLLKLEVTVIRSISFYSCACVTLAKVNKVVVTAIEIGDFIKFILGSFYGMQAKKSNKANTP